MKKLLIVLFVFALQSCMVQERYADSYEPYQPYYEYNPYICFSFFPYCANPFYFYHYRPINGRYIYARPVSGQNVRRAPQRTIQRAPQVYQRSQVYTRQSFSSHSFSGHRR